MVKTAWFLAMVCVLGSGSAAFGGDGPGATKLLLADRSFQHSMTALRQCGQEDDMRRCLPAFWAQEKNYFIWEKNWTHVSPQKYTDFIMTHPEIQAHFRECLRAASYPRLQADGPSPDVVWIEEQGKVKQTGGSADLYGRECYRVTLKHLVSGWKIEGFEQVDECGVE